MNKKLVVLKEASTYPLTSINMAILQAQRLLDRLHAYLPTLPNRVSVIRKNKTPVGNMKVQHILTGLRGVKVLASFTTHLDSQKGHIIRGRPLTDFITDLPRLNNALCPESLLWYLMGMKYLTLNRSADS